MAARRSSSPTSRDGKPVRRICVQADDGRELKLGDMMWVDRATGASVKHARPLKRKGRPESRPF